MYRKINVMIQKKVTDKADVPNIARLVEKYEPYKLDTCCFPFILPCKSSLSDTASFIAYELYVHNYLKNKKTCM